MDCNKTAWNLAQTAARRYSPEHRHLYYRPGSVVLGGPVCPRGYELASKELIPKGLKPAQRAEWILARIVTVGCLRRQANGW